MTAQERTALKEELKSEVREEIMAELRAEGKQPKEPCPWYAVQQEIVEIADQKFSPKETGDKRYLYTLEAFKNIIRVRFNASKVRDLDAEQAREALKIIPAFLGMTGIAALPPIPRDNKPHG